jgi:hypothetical protein
LNYPEAIHITCVARSLHSVRETIFVLYPDADKLVASGKKISAKSPARTELFKHKAPDTSCTHNFSDYTLGNLVGCHSILRRN